jgi:hypothetical protein
MKQAIKSKPVQAPKQAPQPQTGQPQQAGITVFVVVPRPSAHLSYLEKIGNPHIVRQAEFLEYLDDRYGDGNKVIKYGRVKLDGEFTRLAFPLAEIYGSRKDAIIAANTRNRHRAVALEDAAKALRKFKAT